MSQAAMLAAVFRAHGADPQLIGWIFTVNAIGLVAASALSGSLIARCGGKSTMLAGGLCWIGGVLALPGGHFDPVALLAGNLVRGVGSGLIMTSGLLLAQAAVPEADRSRALGLFNAGFLLPSVIGPGLAEWMMHHYGDVGFFAAVAVPTVSALVLTLSLAPTGKQPPSRLGYLALLADRRLWVPALSMVGTGIGFAFAQNFLALFMAAVVWFWVPFAIGIALTRIIAWRRLQRLPARVLVGAGLGSYALGFAVLSLPLVAGALFGVGYGIVGPAAMAWGTAYYPAGEAARARPLALLTLAFQAGAILTAQTVGAVL
jgi:MFS family permease